MRYRTQSAEKTQTLALLLARELASHPPKTEGAMVVGLVGELGAGKTTFAQGFARGLGVRRRIPSPTFILMRRYPIRTERFFVLIHADAYRLNHAAEARAFQWDAIVRDPNAIVLVEWADRVRSHLPHDTLWVSFKHSHRRTRVITLGA